MITLDDVVYNDLGYLSSDIPFVTPNLDALAADGIILTRYYGQSLCTPARASLLSGKFVHRTGFSTKSGDIEVFPLSNYSVPLGTHCSRSISKVCPSRSNHTALVHHLVQVTSFQHQSNDLPSNKLSKDKPCSSQT